MPFAIHQMRCGSLRLARMPDQAPHTAPFIETLEAILARLDLPRYMDILHSLLHGERR